MIIRRRRWKSWKEPFAYSIVIILIGIGIILSGISALTRPLTYLETADFNLTHSVGTNYFYISEDGTYTYEKYYSHQNNVEKKLSVSIYEKQNGELLFNDNPEMSIEEYKNQAAAPNFIAGACICLFSVFIGIVAIVMKIKNYL